MKEMKNKLAQIHASLSQTENLDPELKEILAVLDQDIQKLLQKEAHVPFAYAGLEEVARGLVVKFANAHPNIALLVGQLADMLGKMGV